jgi:hypothetical protein
MRFATFTMSNDPRDRVGVCTPDGTSLIDIAQVSEDAALALARAARDVPLTNHLEPARCCGAWLASAGEGADA